MNYNNSEELDTMKRLINYGKVEESVNTGALTPRVEYSTVGADGKTYGIIRECNKFYIKVAPKKNTKVLAEDFDYIGGFMNKKENEYPTYSMASKQFDLKMMSLNEAYSVKQPVTQFKETEDSEWQIQETKEMRNEINRFNQILGNVSKILKEDKDYVVANNNNVPEAPASHPSDKKVNAPFTDTAVAKGDKDFTKTETNHEKAGAPFNKDGEVTDKDMQSDKTPTENTDAVYSEKAKYVPDNAVADKKPGGGKVVRVSEGKHTIKLTEAQVLAWNKNKDFMDKSNGTEIGSSAPFSDEVGCESNQCEADTEAIHEDTVAYNTDNQNTPEPHTGEVGDKAPFDEKVNEEIVDVDDVAGMDTDDDVPFPEVEDGGAYLGFEKDYNDFEEKGGFDEPEYEFELDMDAKDSAMGDMYDEFDFSDDFSNESIRRNRRLATNEGELHDFGKHPAYRKKPMTLPPNKEVAPNGARDWNDKSVAGEEPFGTKIGSSAPFDEKALDVLTDAIMQKMGFSKKA